MRYLKSVVALTILSTAVSVLSSSMAIASSEARAFRVVSSSVTYDSATHTIEGTVKLKFVANGVATYYLLPSLGLTNAELRAVEKHHVTAEEEVTHVFTCQIRGDGDYSVSLITEFDADRGRVPVRRQSSAEVVFSVKNGVLQERDLIQSHPNNVREAPTPSSLYNASVISPAEAYKARAAEGHTNIYIEGRITYDGYDCGAGVSGVPGAKVYLDWDIDLDSLTYACPFEPPRDCRRLHSVRGWSYEHTQQIFPRDKRASGPDGHRPHQRV